MNLWAVAMVKDEIDILEHTLTHLATEGVNTILVADNLSTDGTWEQLQTLDVGCELRYQRDYDPAYYQSHKISELARRAFAAGADWVIPFDADELWYSQSGTLHSVIEGLDADIALATLYNYHPTGKDDETEPNPYRRIRYRGKTPAEFHKVAVRRGPVTIAQGNHDATGPAHLTRTKSTIEIAHFPWRGFERFKRKIENGYAAYQATNLSEDIGAHWRLYGDLLNRRGEDALREMYETWFLDPDEKLDYVPAPWRQHQRSQQP